MAGARCSPGGGGGRWFAPDLPGHGGSRPLPDYTFDTLAAAVAGTASGGDRTVVLGHSLGDVVGLVLASGGFAVHVQAVVGLGIKVAWTRQELDRAQAAAHWPVPWFASREEAAARYLRISGLAGLVSADAPAVTAGLRPRPRARPGSRTMTARGRQHHDGDLQPPGPRPITPRAAVSPAAPDPGTPGSGTAADRLAYSVTEAARLTGLSRDLLYDEMRRGHLSYVKVGRRRVITRQHLERFLGVAS